MEASIFYFQMKDNSDKGSRDNSDAALTRETVAWQLPFLMSQTVCKDGLLCPYVCDNNVGGSG